MRGGKKPQKNTPARRSFSGPIVHDPPEFTRQAVFGRVVVTCDPTEKREEMEDDGEKQPRRPTRGSFESKRILSEAFRNLGSRQDPISPAVRCGNCTVMAFYVTVLRWLIICTLHTPSPVLF